MKQAIPILFVLASLLAAGCIELPEEMQGTQGRDWPSAADDEPTSTNDIRLPPQEGRMTAEESTEESETLCLGRGPISLPDLPIYCATRVTTVAGDMTLTSLPFEILADTGDVEVVAGDEGAWSVVFTVSASGSTPEAARARLDRTVIEWSIEGERGHRLHASAQHEDRSTGLEPSNDVSIVVTLPAGALYGGFVSTSTGDAGVGGLSFEALVVSTSTGDIAVSDVRASILKSSASTGSASITGKFGRIVASASTGDIDVEAETVDADVSTSTGSITAALTPTATGHFDLGASTGEVELRVPEAARHGYDVEAEASTGTVKILLEDGDVKTSEDRDEASFTTSGFARRAVRTTVSLDTSTGDITVAPA